MSESVVGGLPYRNVNSKFPNTDLVMLNDNLGTSVCACVAQGWGWLGFISR